MQGRWCYHNRFDHIRIKISLSRKHMTMLSLLPTEMIFVLIVVHIVILKLLITLLYQYVLLVGGNMSFLFLSLILCFFFCFFL